MQKNLEHKENEEDMIFSDAYRYVLKVDPSEIYYLCGIFESYSSLAVLRTIDREEALIELLASPYYRSEIEGLIDSLKKETPVTVVSEKSCAIKD